MLLASLPTVYSLLACSAFVSAHPLQARTAAIDLGYTKYQGTDLSNGVSQWLGMRYAAPPLGDLRFRAPKDPIADSKVNDADTYGDICLATSQTTIAGGNSEDCLFVNVFAPTAAVGSKKLPVYIFIQGGGFNSLSNANYNGSGLITASDMNIVIVTFNYRVGPYGFLTSKEVQANGDLNIGLKDQRMVFEWVQSHISKFGGDPKSVTIGGDSAGGASVDLQLSAYGGRDDGLFHAAAAESQSFGVQFTVEQSQYQYDALVSRANCASASDTLACLRALTQEKLQAININIPSPGGAGGAPLYMYSNVIDGDFTQDYTYNEYQNGHFIKVPVIFGDDTNGGTIFTPPATSNVTQMNNFLQDQFPFITTDQMRQIDINYPVAEQFPNTGLYWRAVSNAYGEMRYMCPGLYISAQYSKSNTPNWNYRYNVQDPAQVAEGLGVPHTVEVNAIWGPENVNGGAPASYSTLLNEHIVPVMQGYWTSFIRAHDPNTYRLSGTPEWDEFDASSMNRIKFETNTTSMEIVDLGMQTRCTYLEGIGPENQQSTLQPPS